MHSVSNVVEQRTSQAGSDTARLVARLAARLVMRLAMRLAARLAVHNFSLYRPHRLHVSNRTHLVMDCIKVFFRTQGSQAPTWT